MEEEEIAFERDLSKSVDYDSITIPKCPSYNAAKNSISEFLSQIEKFKTIIYCADTLMEVEAMRQMLGHMITKQPPENYHFLTLKEMKDARYRGSGLVVIDLYSHNWFDSCVLGVLADCRVILYSENK